MEREAHHRSVGAALQLRRDLDHYSGGILGRQGIPQGCLACTGVGKGAHHEGLGPALQLRGNLDLGRGSAGDQEALVHKAADDAERIVQAACTQKHSSQTGLLWGLKL